MNQRGYPLWLLCDWTAFFGFLIAFWAFIFAGFRAGRRVARGRKLNDSELQSLFHLYANAESRLDHALCRQAWRACGCSARHAPFVQIPAPTNTQELEDRFLAFKHALHDIESLVVAYTDDLRRRLALSRADIGDPNAVAAPHRAVRLAARRPSMSRNPHVYVPRGARARVASSRATARGPPLTPTAHSPLSRWPRQRDRSRAPTAWKSPAPASAGTP